MESYYLQQILQVLNDIKTMCVVYLPFVKNCCIAIVFGIFVYMGFNSFSKRWLR